MGEFIFSFGFGGALIVMGVIVHFLLKRMEKDTRTETDHVNIKKEA